MPLAEVSAILFLAPLFVTLLSAPLLGERVGAHRWGSVVVGFTGALLIIRPGIEVVQLAVLVPLAGAAMMALYQIATRIMGRTDAALTSVVYTPLVGTLVFRHRSSGGRPIPKDGCSCFCWGPSGPSRKCTK